MLALVSLILIFVLSMMIVRIGSIALEMTGMSQDIASFQSLSAFSGAGYTTQEAEDVINYPERRRIIKNLIRLGNVGVITSIASLVLSFMNAPTDPVRITIIASVAVFLAVFSRTQWFDQLVNPPIRHILNRKSSLNLRDYTGLLNIDGNYQVADINVDEDDYLANRTLAELDFDDGHIIFLSIRRPDGTFIAAPTGANEIHPKDTVIVYGHEDQLQQIASASKSNGFKQRALNFQDQFDK